MRDDARQQLLGQDHLGATPDAAIQHLLRQRPAQPLFEVVLGMEAGRGRADDLHPALERKLLSVGLVDLEPRPVDGLLGVEDQAVEVEDESANHVPKD